MYIERFDRYLSGRNSPYIGYYLESGGKGEIYGVKESRRNNRYIYLIADEGLVDKNHRVRIIYHDGKILDDIDDLADIIVREIFYLKREHLWLSISSGYVVDRAPYIAIYKTDRSRMARDANGRLPPEDIDCYKFKYPTTEDNIIQRLEQLVRNQTRPSFIELVDYDFEDINTIARELRIFKYLPSQFIYKF